MDAAAVLSLFRETEALLDGHFKLSSGLHSPRYLQSARVLQYPEMAERLGRALADRLRPLEPAVVVGPALGGVIIGHEVARGLGVRSVFTERQEGQMTLRSGFSFSPGERAVVVEDVLTTGTSTRETCAALAAAGATVVGAAAIIDRSGGRGDLGVPFEALVSLSVPAYEPSACPLCAAGQPFVKPGSRGN